MPLICLAGGVAFVLLERGALVWTAVGVVLVAFGLAVIVAPASIRAGEFVLGWGPLSRKIKLASVEEIGASHRFFGLGIGEVSCITYRAVGNGDLRVLPGSPALRDDLIAEWLGALVPRIGSQVGPLIFPGGGTP